MKFAVVLEVRDPPYGNMITHTFAEHLSLVPALLTWVKYTWKYRNRRSDYFPDRTCHVLLTRHGSDYFIRLKHNETMHYNCGGYARKERKA